MELGASGWRVRRLTKRVDGGEEAGYFPKLDFKPQRGKKQGLL